MKEKNPIDDLVFKPIMVKYEGDSVQHLVIVYGSSTETKQLISSSGKRTKEITNVLQVVDVTKTLEFNKPVLDTIIIQNLNKFKQNIVIADIKEKLQEVVHATSLIIEEVQGMNSLLEEYGNALTGIKFISTNGIKKLQSEEDIDSETGGNIIFATDTAPLANVVFKTISGANGKLNGEDIERIGHVMMEIMSDYITQDIDDPDCLRRLKAEMEYKIVEALPHSLKAGDITINMDTVVEELKKNQGGQSEDNEG